MTTAADTRIHLTVNGLPVAVDPGTTVLNAALAAGVDIPHLCHHPALSVSGGCRLCLVEVEGARGLVTACSTPATEGMVVRTETEKTHWARKSVLELIVSDHPLDCMTCQQGGNCLLQDYAYEYGIGSGDRRGARHKARYEDANPFIVRDLEKCILCGRCVRACHEISGVGAVDYAGRGFDSHIAAPFDLPLENSDCVFCGNCVTVCPVGALIPKKDLGAGRAHQRERTLTTCPYCGVGCNFYIETRNGKIVGVSPADGPANENWLCVKGRFGWDFVQHPDRVTKPLIRKDGQLVEAEWDEALDLVARRLKEIKAEHGPGVIGGLSSAKCTNEENYLFQKFVRAALGTNNVDHCARLCHSSTVTGLAATFGSGAMTNSIPDLKQADAFFIIGSNTTESHPVIGIAVQQALNRGAKLIVADPRPIDMARKADIWLRHEPGTDIALINGMMHVIWRDGLYDRKFVAERTEDFDALVALIKKYTPEYVSTITHVPATDIERAAHMYAEADSAAILYAMGITQHSCGTANVMSTSNLALLTGNVGKPGAGVNPLRGQNNVQGACDMGALPNVYPGYQSVTDPSNAKKFSAAWGVDLDTQIGLTVTEMMVKAYEGEIKALYVMGENPMVSDPDLTHVEEALDRLDFLVVQDIFLTETALKADVVLPGASYAEKEGTFTNTERRVQRVRQAIAPVGQSRPDWQIICDVATQLGYPMRYDSPAAILDELATLTPSYAGISFRRLDHEVGGRGLQWPCPSADHPGTQYLYADKFSRPSGKAKFMPLEHVEPDERPDERYPLLLTTGRTLYHFHTGSMTRRSSGLDAVISEGYVEISPAMARRYGLHDGDRVRVMSRRGAVKTRVKIADGIKPDVVFMPFHFAEAAANRLTNAALDPQAKIPEYKVAAVELERLDEAEAAPAAADVAALGGGKDA